MLKVGDEEDDTFTMSRMLPADSVELVDGFAGLNMLPAPVAATCSIFSATGLQHCSYRAGRRRQSDRLTGDDLVIGGAGNDPQGAKGMTSSWSRL